MEGVSEDRLLRSVIKGRKKFIYIRGLWFPSKRAVHEMQRIHQMEGIIWGWEACEQKDVRNGVMTEDATYSSVVIDH